ncbi:MAG: BatA domain-containing protein [Planctomycetota bacterium]
MSFVNPALLAAGLLAVALPIIIHLLMRRRRQPVRWAAMRFLMEAYRRQQRRVTLEQIILLTARCLVVLFLALALGRPLLGAAAGVSGSAPVTLFLMLDDSLTSGVQVGEASAFAANRERAIELLEELNEDRGDRAAVVTLSEPASAVVLPPSGDLAAVRRVLQTLEPTVARTSPASAVALLTDHLPEPGEGRAMVAWLSESRSGSVEAGTPVTPPPSPPTSLVAIAPPDADVGNVAITDVRPLRDLLLTGSGDDPGAGPIADSATAVRIALARSGESEAATTTVRVRVLGRASEARATVRWQPGQTEASTTLSINPADLVSAGDDPAAVLEASIDRDALEADNTRRAVVRLRPELRLGVAGLRRFGSRPRLDSYEGADWVRLALRPDRDAFGRPIGAVTTTDLDPASLDTADLATLDGLIITRPDQVSAAGWSRVAEMLSRGGLVIVFPPNGIAVHLWPDAMLAAAFDSEPPIEIASEAEDVESLTIGIEQPTTGDDLLGLIRAELSELARPVTIARRLPITAAQGQPVKILLATSDGQPLLTAVRASTGTSRTGGLLITSSVALDVDWSNLPATPLVVPLLQELTRQGAGVSAGVASIIAGNAPTLPPNAATLRRLDETDAGAVLDATTTEPIRDAAAYAIEDERGRRTAAIAINPDTRGSDTTTQPRDSVEAWLTSAFAGASPIWLDDTTTNRTRTGGDRSSTLEAGLGDGAGAGLSAVLFAAALAFAAIEMILARFFSHAKTSSDSTPGIAA